MTKKEDKAKTIIQNAQSLDANQKRVQIRKNAQQTLLFLHDIIAKGNERYYTGDINSGKLPALTEDSYDDVRRLAGGFYADELGAYDDDPGWRSGYRNIIPIEKGSEYADGVSPLVGLGKNVEKFFSFELTSAQQAALYPRLRLYKIIYELDGKGNIKLPQKEKSRQEIIFEKAITSQELNILTARGGNIGSSGIESFEWKLMGVNPADTDSNIEASLKIYFNNVGVFAERIAQLNAASDLAKSAATNTVPAIATAQRDAAALLRDQAHFLDLITFAPPTTKGSNSLPCNEVYDPSFFEILAEVGWEAPEGSSRLFSTDQITHIKDQTVKLYLTLTDHKFDFKEDGSATLVANYRARQNFSDPEYDLLYPTTAIATAIKNEQLKATSAATNAPEKGIVDKAIEAAGDLQAYLTGEDLSSLLKENYKRIVSGLLDNMYQVRIPTTLLLNNIVPLSAPQPGSATGTRNLTDQATATVSFAQLFQLLQNQDPSNPVDIDLSNAIAEIQYNYKNNLAIVKPRRRTLSAGARETILERTLDDTDLSSDEVARQVLFSARLNPSLTRSVLADVINYFYLGDILEVMFETIALTRLLHDRKIAFVTTDFTYINLLKIIEASKINPSNYEVTIQNFDFSKLRCSEKSLPKSAFNNFYSVLNVANIPIEAAAFLDFFTEKVIAQERQNYYLNNFLADLFTQLVKPALGDNAIQGMPNNQPALINTDVSVVDNIDSPLFDPTLFNERDPTYQENAYKLFLNDPGEKVRDSNISLESQYTFINTINGYQKLQLFSDTVLLQNPLSKTNNNIATVKIIGVNGGASHFDGKYQTNINEGIVNFVVGLDRGLIKSVSFERVDQPYLRESRTATDKSFGIGQLRELYNVNLTLYGNNLVKPGQMIYVEPNRFIFGRPTEKNSVSRLLGLGGYHLVVDVSNTIGKEGWETSVKALHMSMPVDYEEVITSTITSAQAAP